MSATWKEPVTDRSDADLAQGTDRAYLNAADLNRIEGNVAYLSEALARLQWRVMTYSAVMRTEADVPTLADFAALCTAIEGLTKAYHDPDPFDVRMICRESLTYAEINRLENKLRLMKMGIDGTLPYNTHTDLHMFTNRQLSAYSYDKVQKKALTV